jgi:3-hydroxyisobutyrate dehydrogenase
MRIALVGYGEAGGIFAAGLAKAGHAVRVFDILAADPSWSTAAVERAARDGVELSASLADAVADAELVISAVTAADTGKASHAIAAACSRDCVVLDVNSASPRTKANCAQAFEQSGARYVEAAVMSAVPPHGLRVPMLLGGPHAAAAQPMLAGLGFDATVGSERYGVVSAIKLCRSVVVKGMEALAVESLLTARRYGVEAEVLASLAESFPGMDWDKQSHYFWRRVVQHGKRRAEEMREAAIAVEDVDVPPSMATAIAEVQARIASARADGVFANLGLDDWRALADRIPQAANDSGTS